MKIEIVKIIDRGVANKERLWLRVKASVNLSYYVVFDTKYIETNSISNVPRHTFWFPPKDVRIGDDVILYTGKGEESEKPNSLGGKNYFYHWGFDKTIWNEAGDCAVLLELANWNTSKHE